MRLLLDDLDTLADGGAFRGGGDDLQVEAQR